jgi:DNA gyrase subunit A
MNITEKTGEVVSIMEVQDSDDLVVMTTGGILIRQPVKDVRIIGRNTQGVRLIRLEEGDQIADITTVPHEDEEDGGEDSGTPEATPQLDLL